MRKREQIPFDPVALDAEIDAAVKASLDKLAKKNTISPVPRKQTKSAIHPKENAEDVLRVVDNNKDED